jgi:hypothetical protein
MALGEALKKRYGITFADLTIAKELLDKCREHIENQ